MPENDLMEIAEASAYLHLSPAALANRRYLAQPPRWVKLGKKVLYSEAVLSQWVSDCERTSTAA
jgi:hypothetical protein